MGDGPPTANPDTAIDFAPGAPEGKGEEPSRRQRVGPWAPVIPLKVGPHVAGGDTPFCKRDSLAGSPRGEGVRRALRVGRVSDQQRGGVSEEVAGEGGEEGDAGDPRDAAHQ